MYICRLGIPGILRGSPIRKLDNGLGFVRLDQK